MCSETRRLLDRPCREKDRVGCCVEGSRGHDKVGQGRGVHGNTK